MDKKIEVIRKIESITQTQYDSKEYLEAGYSVFPYNGNSNDTGTFLACSATDFDILDNLEVDVESLDLYDVIITLHAQGLLKTKEVKIFLKD